jgi:hypothetical protein
MGHRVKPGDDGLRRGLESTAPRRRMLARHCAVLSSLIMVAPIALGQEVQTLKERLSDKASDAQRVDNCRVPVERRGEAPRPDCPTELPAAPPTVEMVPSISREPR